MSRPPHNSNTIATQKLYNFIADYLMVISNLKFVLLLWLLCFLGLMSVIVVDCRVPCGINNKFFIIIIFTIWIVNFKWSWLKHEELLEDWQKRRRNRKYNEWLWQRWTIGKPVRWSLWSDNKMDVCSMPSSNQWYDNSKCKSMFTDCNVLKQHVENYK